MEDRNPLKDIVISSKATATQISECYGRVNKACKDKSDLISALLSTKTVPELVECAIQDKEIRELYMDIAMVKAYHETCVNISSLLSLKSQLPNV